MPIDLVVFDMAGTTVYDGDAVHTCLATAVAHAGVPTTRDQINALMGMPKPFVIASLLSSGRGTPPSDEEVASIYSDFERLMLDHYRHSIHVRETDRASEVFRALHARGIKVALDTGFSRAITNAILDRLGWTIDVVDAGRERRSRPRAAASRHGLARDGADRRRRRGVGRESRRHTGRSAGR